MLKKICIFQKTYIHRVIYVGEQYFGKDEQIVEYFSDTVKRANSVFHHEKVTGFLLIYTKYFIHLIEVSKHLDY